MSKLLLAIIFAFIPSIAWCGDFCFNNHHVSHIQKFNIVDKFNVIQKTVEFDAEYFLGYNGYYEVVDKLRAEEYTKDRDILLKQSEQLDRLIGLLELSLKSNVGVGVVPSQPTAEEPSVPVLPNNPDVPSVPAEPVPPTTNDNLDTQVFNIFKSECASCHGVNSQEAGLQLVGRDGDEEWLKDLSLADRVLVYDLTAGINLSERGKKLMPMGGTPLSDEDVEVLRLWMVKKAEQIKKGEN